MLVTERDHILGGHAAGITLVEYGDYECSYCALAQPTIGQLAADLGNSLRYVFRHFPLTEIHPQAEGAAETAEFAATQGRFWEIHEALYANQGNLGIPLYVELGRSLGASAGEIESVLEKRSFRGRIGQDYQSGLGSGVNGTPAFFVNGQRHMGSYGYDDLRRAIDGALV